MKTIRRLTLLLVVCWLTAGGGAQIDKEPQMKISSPDFIEGGAIPAKFTCDGENTSPTLKIEGVTAAAKSLVLIMDDPDAPKGTFTHWVLWNLKTDLKEILVSSPPQDAAQGLNDFGKNKYGGPCPPSGTHRYYFRLFAIDAVPNLAATSNRAALEKTLEGHVLAKAILMGRYARGGK